MAHILVVCTANICRSPVGEALLQKKLQDEGYIDWRVSSAGTWANVTRGAAQSSIQVMETRGFDLTSHQSQLVTETHLAQADLVLCMEEGHRETLRAEFPQYSRKIHLFSEAIGKQYSISDPYGGPFNEYVTMANELERLVDNGWHKIVAMAQGKYDRVSMTKSSVIRGTMARADLVAYLDDYLKINEIADYGPQGLQVETDNETVQRIALAVDVSPQIIETAVTYRADMLLVHHGIFWGGGQRIVGPLGKRVRLMMKHGLNLYAAHLPLDAHPEVGNNAVLAQKFGVQVEQWWCKAKGTLIGVYGSLQNERPLNQFVADINQQLHTQATVLAHGSDMVHRVAIVSGFGADKVAEAKALGADTLLTGETSHANYWLASDYGLNVIFAGHYATETVGVQALGAHLSQKFGLDVQFFDFPTQM